MRKVANIWEEAHSMKPELRNKGPMNWFIGDGSKRMFSSP